MPRERESDRRGGRGSPKYQDDIPRSRSEREGPNLKKPKHTGLNDYFVDGEGINREVLQRNIAFMLGPEARSKPDKLHGVPGFLITAVRPFTPEQLEDLIEISSEYEKEKRRTKSDVPYDRSQTSQRDYSAVMKDPREPYQEERFIPQNPYAPPNPSDMFGNSPSTFTQQPNFGYPPGSSYSPGPPMTSHSYQAPGYPPSSRSGRSEQPMYYERDDPPRLGDTYRQPNQYPGAPPRDSRMGDPTRPRYMPQMGPMDPAQAMHRGASQNVMQGYMPQQDVHMQDYDDNFEPPRQSRNTAGYPPPPGRMPEDYDFRGPSTQGTYIQRNPREEDRYREKRRGLGKY